MSAYLVTNISVDMYIGAYQGESVEQAVQRETIQKNKSIQLYACIHKETCANISLVDSVI